MRRSAWAPPVKRQLLSEAGAFGSCTVWKVTAGKEVGTGSSMGLAGLIPVLDI